MATYTAALRLANKIKHIFAPKHNLSGWVGKYFDGNNLRAFRALEKAFQELARKNKWRSQVIDGEFSITVAGRKFHVQGWVDKDGVAKLGNAWIP